MRPQVYQAELDGGLSDAILDRTFNYHDLPLSESNQFKVLSSAVGRAHAIKPTDLCDKPDASYIRQGSERLKSLDEGGMRFRRFKRKRPQ